MKFIRAGALCAVVAALAACSSQPATPSLTPGQPCNVYIGIGTCRVTAQDFTTPLPADSFYATMMILPRFSAGQSLLKGPAARTLADKLSSLIGSRAVSLTLKIDVTAFSNGTQYKLPTYFPLSLTYDDSSGTPQWTSTFNDTNQVPWIRYDASTKFIYTISYVASERQASDIVGYISNLAGVANLAPGGWALNAAAQTTVMTAFGNVEQAIDSRLNSQGISSVVTSELNGTDPGRRGVTLSFTDSSSVPWGTVDIVMALRQSLRDGRDIISPLVPTTTPAWPGTDTLSLSTYRNVGGGATIIALAQPILPQLMSSDPATFATACVQLRDMIDSLGLTKYDRWLVTSDFLRTHTHIQSVPTLAATGCVTQDDLDNFATIKRPLYVKLPQ
ncbi:MAG TPA: hypothetical protein VMI56_05735 [Reyranella sp.]|nr:hypothetical protein [Reyranella sp.]